jgi:hypothetical protein
LQLEPEEAIRTPNPDVLGSNPRGCAKLNRMEYIIFYLAGIVVITIIHIRIQKGRF